MCYHKAEQLGAKEASPSPSMVAFPMRQRQLEERGPRWSVGECVHTHRIVVGGFAGKPFFDFGDDFDDFDVRDVFAGDERNTLEELRRFCLDRCFGSAVKLGWTCHMQFFDTVGLECFSAEWTCTRREVPETSVVALC